MQHVGFFIFPHYKASDLSVPLDCFAEANLYAKERGETLPYELHLLAPTKCPVEASNGALIDVSYDINQELELDTLVVVGGNGIADISDSVYVRSWLETIAPQLSRLVAINSGARLLSAAGLLKEQSMAMQRQMANTSQQANAFTHLEMTRPFTQEESIYGASGMSATVELARFLLEQDLGSSTAHIVTQRALSYYPPTAHAESMSKRISAATKGGERFLKLSDFLLNNLHKQITIDSMASSINVSPRHFRRLFKQQFAMAPMVYVEQLRINKAKVLLSSTELAISLVAQQCGYASHEVFSRRFKVLTGVSPSYFRSQF